MNTMLMSPESKPCATSVLQLMIGFRDYHITRPKQNHQSLSSTASCWARRTRRFSKAKVIRSVAIPSPRPLWSFIICLGSSDTPNHKAQHLSSRGPVLACTTTRLDHAKSRTKRSLSQRKIDTMLAGIADVYLGGIGKNEVTR